MLPPLILPQYSECLTRYEVVLTSFMISLIVIFTNKKLEERLGYLYDTLQMRSWLV